MRFLNFVFNLRQLGRRIVRYTREGDQLNAECTKKFRDVYGHQFIARIDDRETVDLAQVYLGAKKSIFSYAEAKSAMEKVYQRFGEASLFGNLNDEPSSLPSTPALQSELVALLQSFWIPQIAPLSQDNPSYRPTYSNANAQNQNGRLSFYRGIYCHNCCEEGHYFISCPRPVVSGAQRDANKRAIDKLQGDSLHYPYGSRPAVELPLALAVPAAVASGGRERQEQSGRKINNIGGANDVMLKQPTIEEAEDNAEDYIYPVTSSTRSQKKNPEAKKFQPTSQITKVVERSLEKTLTNQASKNQDRLNNRNTRSPFLSPPFAEDEEIKNNVTIMGDNHVITGTLHPGKDKQVQFEN